VNPVAVEAMVLPQPFKSGGQDELSGALTPRLGFKISGDAKGGVKARNPLSAGLADAGHDLAAAVIWAPGGKLRALARS